MLTGSEEATSYSTPFSGNRLSTITHMVLLVAFETFKKKGNSEKKEMDLPNKRTGSIHHHGQAKFVFREHIAHCSSCNTQKCTSSESIEEARHQHGSDIFSDGAGDDPYQEEDIRVYINWTAAVEL
jgi:hypothetical protein